MNDINDDVAAAISELEAEGTTATEAVEKLEPTTQERGEDGKFKSTKKVESEETQDPPKVETQQETTTEVKEDPQQAPLGGDPDKQILSQDKAPSSWTPKAREHWASLPEEARKEILRREEDGVKGIRQLQEQMAPFTQFAGTLEPFIKEALDNRVDPGQYIGNVMQAERRLRSGSAEERFSALVEIAEGYGIPLRNIINEAMGTEVIPHPSLAPKATAPSIPASVQQELDEARKIKEDAQKSLIKEIEDFSKVNEFFEDVRTDMAALMDMGRATSLADAYEKACKINPDVQQIIEQRASQPKLSDKQKAAASISGTSSNSAETGNSDFDDDDDTEATVRKAIARASGRI